MPTEQEYKEAYDRIQNNVGRIGEDMALLGQGINFGALGGDNQDTSLGLQDFSGYTVADENSDLTVTTNKIEYDTMRRDANTYVVKDFGANFFDGDFEVHFESEMTVCQTQNSTYFTSFTQVNGTFDNPIGDNIGAVHWLSQANSLRRISVASREDGPDIDFRQASGTTWPLTWFEYKRSGTTITLKGYDGADKQNLTTNLSLTGVTVTPYRYFYALAARNSDSFPSASQTGYVQNVDFKAP